MKLCKSIKKLIYKIMAALIQDDIQVPVVPVTSTKAVFTEDGKCLDDILTNDTQAKLVSGENIKTINNQSILGPGNIDIQGGGGSTAWGSITGTLSDQTDLINELNGKVTILDKDVDLDNIKTTGIYAISEVGILIVTSIVGPVRTLIQIIITESGYSRRAGRKAMDEFKWFDWFDYTYSLDGHTHEITNVNGLQDALNNKLNSQGFVAYQYGGKNNPIEGLDEEDRPCGVKVGRLIGAEDEQDPSRIGYILGATLTVSYPNDDDGAQCVKQTLQSGLDIYERTRDEDYIWSEWSHKTIQTN